MRFFLTLTGLRLKASVRSAVFLTSAVFFLAFTLTLGVLLPRQEQAGLQVGVLADGDVAGRAAGILAQSEDYQLIRYTDEAVLRLDIMMGKLHCGYLLTDANTGTMPPVTVLDTEGAYMRPLLDQLVFSAYFEAGVPEMTGAYLDELKLDTSEIAETFKQVEKTAKPLEIRLQAMGNAKTAPAEAVRGGVQPMVYAVMVTMFVVVCLLGVLLENPAKQRALHQLARVRPVASTVAPVCADVLLYLGLLLSTDLLLGLMLGGQGYPISARLTVFLPLAMFAALLGAFATLIRRAASAICMILPIWMVVSVIYSGALISPDKLSGILGLLRFLSPAWYALRVLGL